MQRQKVTANDPLVTTLAGTKETTGVSTLRDPADGKAVRVIRVWIRGAHANGDSATEFEVKVGSTVLDRDEVIGDAPYVHRARREGAANDNLTLELFAANKVFYVIDVQEFTP